jgi:mannobiose 2-epimerase
MMDRSTDYINGFIESIQEEFRNNLMPFWLQKSTDAEHGGFIGWMSNEGIIDPVSPKALILNTRLLWTFSALYRFNKNEQCRDMARRAYNYLQTFFWDTQHGGAFWQVDYQGNTLDDSKKIYGQAFYIYALSEYFLAFSEQAALDRAAELFSLIDSASHDDIQGGYIEVCNRDWSIAEDLRLSDKDMDEKKSMNNHLHVLEAYTNLYRILPDIKLKTRLIELLELFATYIIDSNTGHMNHFFDENWYPKSQNYTFGHDIEASWLLYEAAEVLGDPNITSRTENLALHLARVTLVEGLYSDGGLCYEGQAGKVTDPNRQWWPQAETVVGFLNAYQLCREESFLTAARKTWNFITNYIVDKKHGDWFWRIDESGRPDKNEPKVSQWKGPYHSVRMCIEATRKLRAISNSSTDKGE